MTQAMPIAMMIIEIVFIVLVFWLQLKDPPTSYVLPPNFGKGKVCRGENPESGV